MNGVTAFATVALCVVTAVYTDLVALTLREMKAQRMDEARPVVSFSAIFLDLVHMRFQMKVGNIGAGPALNVQVDVLLPRLEKGHWEQVGWCTLAAGESAILTFDTPDTRTPSTTVAADHFAGGSLRATCQDIYRRTCMTRGRLKTSRASC